MSEFTTNPDLTFVSTPMKGDLVFVSVTFRRRWWRWWKRANFPTGASYGGKPMTMVGSNRKGALYSLRIGSPDDDV